MPGKLPIQINYPDKILFHQKGITKLQVAEYYNEIAPFILPYLKQRPQYFRWHRGSIKESVYSKSIETLQEDWKGSIPDWVQTVSHSSITYGENRNYFVCKNKKDLLFLIEIGCVELSPWHSTVKHLDFPDYIVIDLDPVDVPFDTVVEVALTSKQVLDGLKIPNFVKTSGSKGMHLYVPLDAKSTYEVARNFCEFLCKLIHEQIPDITSLKRSPSDRKEKVYLDFLQNAIGKTIASPYCLRPNEDAAVATPLFWKEIKSGIRIRDYNIDNIVTRIKTIGDPFENLFTKKFNIEKFVKGFANSR